MAARARALEAAAKKGDLGLIKKDLQGFNAGLSSLLAQLASFISVNSSALADPGASLDPKALRRLIEALEAEEISKIDELLEAMPRVPDDSPMGVLIAGVGEDVLRLELAKAADLIRDYLASRSSESPEASGGGPPKPPTD